MTILRPNIRILDELHKEDIFNEAKNILETIGVYIENLAVKEMFREQDIPNQGSRYFIPEDVVNQSLENIPREIILYDRDGEKSLELKADNAYSNPGSAAMHIIDENTGERRHAFENDFIGFSKVVEQLKYIEAQSTALICDDIPIKAQDWHRLYICLSNCYKPIITGTFRKESFEIMKELLLACRSSERDLAAKPLAIFDAAPSPPLKWSDLTSQAIIDCANNMIPCEFVSMPLAGANAPITLLGSITQMCAENLAGVVISQMTKKGAPLIWGGSPSAMDMKSGLAPIGAIESVMITIGNVEMGKYLGFPTHAYLGVSDSLLPDVQSGFEAAISLLLGIQAGVNVISGPGMLESEVTQSIEKLIIDNDIVGMAKRFISGVKDYPKPYASNILKDYNKREELLSHPSTIKYFKEELFFPSHIVKRMAYSRWKDKGSKSTRAIAREEAIKLKSAPSKKPISDALLKELKEIVSANLNKKE
ncbi:MAG: hypothetical protein GF383_01500 [Candidatus Lokiarchaeota archaeon]|nr:hypothetical protein [Candidatus Lokiarchaeota archaeon]MBD3337939.1 hypothetical protein [Candidatus Lokiarchaeota archaeon]